MKPLSRRSVIAGSAAALTAIPVVGLDAGTEPDLLERVRTFARELLAGGSKLTGGEWVERKRIANMLLAFIDDEIEPWAMWEVELIAAGYRRTGPMGEVRRS